LPFRSLLLTLFPQPVVVRLLADVQSTDHLSYVPIEASPRGLNEEFPKSFLVLLPGEVPVAVDDENLSGPQPFGHPTIELFDKTILHTGFQLPILG